MKNTFFALMLVSMLALSACSTTEEPAVEGEEVEMTEETTEEVAEETMEEGEMMEEEAMEEGEEMEEEATEEAAE